MWPRRAVAPAPRRRARGTLTGLYAESSAVLAWLFGEQGGEEVRAALAEAGAVFASGLTIVECERVLIRRTFLGEFTEADAASRLARLTAAASRWTVLHVAEPVLDRARRAFPSEPVRTLDAIHLSSALAARAAVPDVAILALDEAIRRNGTALGFTVLPTT